jgi:hypothetical protein
LKIIYTITGEGQETTSSSSFSVRDDRGGESGFINKVKLTKYLTSDELNNSNILCLWISGDAKGNAKLLQEDLQISVERIKIAEFTGY